MNVTGFLRGYLSKNLDEEKFIKLVGRTIESQLKEWDEHYEMFIMKFQHYEVYVRNQEQEYHSRLSEVELKTLQKRSPFSLDEKIWFDFKNQGMTIHKGYGDYIEKVLGE